MRGRYRFASFVTFGLVTLFSSLPIAAGDPEAYRDFRLGSSTADVIARAGAQQRDVKKLHERPALLEELSWRPRYTIGGNSTDRDSVALIVFSFIDDQLFKMAIDYDKSRTEGLTNGDMIASLIAIYGPQSAAPAPPRQRSAFDSFDPPNILARWRQGDTSIMLQESAYGGGFGLVIVSVPLEALARKAQASAVTMEAREAPLREAARARAQAEEEKAAAEKTRTTNKATFKP